MNQSPHPIANTPHRPGMLGACLLCAAVTLPGALPAAHAGGNELLYSRGAQIQKRPSMDLRVNWFEDALLEELRGFDGYQVNLDATWPLSPESQVRVVLPIYTEGDGTFFYDGVQRDEHLDLEGNGGTFEFPSIIYERRFRAATAPGGWDMAYAFGLGSVIEPVDVYFGDINVDRFNHSGYKAILGLMAENDGFAGASRFVGNATVEFYTDTDDLNPSDGSTNFQILTFSGALQYGAQTGPQPAVELVYTTDLEEYDNLLLVPQVSARLGGDWQISAGVPIQVSGDGQEKGVNLKIEKFF